MTVPNSARGSGSRGRKTQLKKVTKCSMSAIACNMDASGLRGRQQLLSRLIAGASHRRETGSGYAFCFGPGTVSLVELAEVIEPERRCCPFFRFVVTIEPEGGAGLAGTQRTRHDEGLPAGAVECRVTARAGAGRGAGKASVHFRAGPCRSGRRATIERKRSKLTSGTAIH